MQVQTHAQKIQILTRAYENPYEAYFNEAEQEILAALVDRTEGPDGFRSSQSPGGGVLFRSNNESENVPAPVSILSPKTATHYQGLATMVSPKHDISPIPLSAINVKLRSQGLSSNDFSAPQPSSNARSPNKQYALNYDPLEDDEQWLMSTGDQRHSRNSPYSGLKRRGSGLMEPMRPSHFPS